MAFDNLPIDQNDDLTPEEWRQYLLNARAALHANPNDEEAFQAMQDAIKALNLADQPSGGVTTSGAYGYDESGAPTGDRSVLGTVGGVARGLLDIPQAIYGAVRHPIKTLGQMSGVSNIPHAWNTIFHDPEADWAEKLDAAVRATPLNIGYAPERAFMENMANPSTSSFDRARSGTNVASLALFGLGAKGRGATRAPLLTPKDILPVGDMALKSAQRAPTPSGPPPVRPPVGDPTLTPPSSGVTPPAAKTIPPLEPIPNTGGRGFYAEGPPTKPMTPAMEAFSEVRTGIPRAPRPRGSGGTAQKAITFGEESPLSPAARAEVKGLVGEITRGPRPQAPAPGSATELINGIAKGTTSPMLGFSVGPFLAWEIMRRTIRPMIDRIVEHGVNPMEAMRAIRANPKLAALEQALVKAYMAGETERVNQISQELAAQLMMQVPPPQEQ